MSPIRLSGVVSPTDVKTVSIEGANQSVAGNCTDNAGNSVSDTQSGINIDLTAPTLSPTVSPNPVLLNGSATASPNASDTLSGIVPKVAMRLYFNRRLQDRQLHGNRSGWQHGKCRCQLSGRL